MGPRERNICGVSNRVLPELAIQNAFNVAAFKKLGLFYNPREKNSKISLKWIIKLGSQMGFEVIPLRCPPEGPLFKENLEKVTSRSIDVDAVYLPSDSFLVSRAGYIGKALQRTRIISIGAIRQFIEKGVMLGTVPDYYNMGTMAAGILDRHQRGEKLSDIPVQIPENPALIINTTTADRLGIKIDRSLLEKAIIVR